MTTGAPVRRPPRHGLRRWIVGVALVALLAGLGFLGRFTYQMWTDPTCRVTAGGKTFAFSPEQTRNAATISGVAMRRHLPARAATIALATALQESNLRNLRYGDRDSLGLFQQRPSQGWGTEAQIMDPVYAANAFFDALVKIDGYATMNITTVAQKVQRSAYPEAYADHEGQGRVLASTLFGHSPAGLACRFEAAGAPGDSALLLAALAAETGYTGTATGETVTVRAGDTTGAWAVATWAVASAGQFGTVRVDVADRSWQRARGRHSLNWVATDGPPSGTTVTVTVA